MIVEWFLTLAAGAADWALSLLGSEPAPEWLLTVGVFVTQQINSYAGLGAWIPWDFAIIIGGTVLTLWLVVLGVKFVRWVVGWIPTMGGS